MTETTIFCEVEGDEEHEHYSFYVQSETAPAVGDAVLYWIDDIAKRQIEREGDSDDKDHLQHMRRALFFVTRRQFEIREITRAQPKAYWQVTMRHATPEEAKRWGGGMSNLTRRGDNPMTDADAEMIAELERLTAERTQGEWAVDGFHTSAVIVRAGDKWQNVADADTDSRPNQNWYADAQFIAASGRFLPRLLALAKEAQAARAEAGRLGALLDRAHADNEQLRAALQEQRDE